MLKKNLPAKVKAVDGDQGVFEAIVATYDVDSIGDKIVPGAFTKSLDEWAASGDPIPIVWSHMHNDPFAHIGHVLEAKETDEGLWVKGQVDLDNPTARQVYKLIKGGRIRNYSFAYEVLDEAPGEKGENLLKELGLFEVGPTMIGVNRGTRTTAAKSAVGRHETATSDEAWDGPANEARLSTDSGADTYRQAYAWNDPDADADTKAAWKFIHHFVAEDGTVGAASTVACSAGIAVLNGGRGGAAIPDADRQGVYDHLAGHLRDAGKEPPELAADDADDEKSGAGDVRDEKNPETFVKAGRVLSTKNESDLRQAADLINGVLAQLEKDQDGKAQPAAPAKPEAPSGGKGEEPNQTGPALDDLVTEIDLMIQEGKMA